MDENESQLDGLRTAVEERPDDPAPYVALARALMERGRGEEAARALGAFEGTLSAADREQIDARAEVADGLLAEVRTPLALGALARALADRLHAGGSEDSLPRRLAETLDRFLEHSGAAGVDGAVDLPGGWRARHTPERAEHAARFLPRILQKIARPFYLLALLLPIAVYAGVTIAAVAVPSEKLNEWQIIAALSVLPGALLVLAGRLLAWLLTPCTHRWCGRQAVVMVAVAAVLTGLGVLAGLGVGVPYWLTGGYGALMGLAYVNRRFWQWYEPHIEWIREYRWVFEHRAAGRTVTLAKNPDGTLTASLVRDDGLAG